MAYIKNLLKRIFRKKDKLIKIEDIETTSDNLQDTLKEDDNIQKKVRIIELLEVVSYVTQQLADIGMKINQNNDIVASEISTVSANVNEESNNLQEVNSNILSMACNIEEISQSTSKVTYSTLDASNLVKTGDKVIKDLLDQMKVIDSNMVDISSEIEELKERSGEVQRITDTIKSISSQTKLLALNAAIEAARAGEQGRGFAVVADEVKKLSEQANNSTGEIIKLVEKIIERTGSAFDKVNKGSLQVTKGSELAVNANIIFNDILKLVSDINEKMQRIASSTQENSAASQTVLSSINIVTEKSKSNAQGSANACALTENQTSSSLELMSLIQQIDEILKELKLEASEN